MVSLEVVAILLSGISISASLFYYTTTLQNASKARQIEMLQRLHETKYNVEGLQNYFELLALTWEDFEDYLLRFGGPNNPLIASKMESLTQYYDGLGLLLKNKVIDLDTVYEISGNRILSYWFKFENIIKGLRTFESGPGSEYCLNFEYLADELIRIRMQKGTSFPVHNIHPTSTLHDKYNR